MATTTPDPDPLAIAAARIRRFELLGGVDLSRLEPQERWDTKTNIQMGLEHHRKAVFWFHCEICGKRESNDQEMEPMCTGPGWTDDHEPAVMVRTPQGG